MDGQKITIDELLDKGYVKDEEIGIVDVYCKEHSWGKKVLLYQRIRGEVLVSSRVPKEDYRL